MRIIDCEQRSPEWFAARRGLPTASEFGNIMTPVQMKYAAAATTYINRLIDQIVRPEAEQAWNGNRHTDRGCELEPEAREVYAFEQDVVLRQVGLVLNDAGELGCSPDSLVLPAREEIALEAIVADLCERTGLPMDEELAKARVEQWPVQYAGGLEVKCPDGPTMVEWLRAGGLPAEYKAQVHGSLIVTGLPWWDFMAYCPPYPPLVVRTVPDAFTEALAKNLQIFLGEYRKARESILERVS